MGVLRRHLNFSLRKQLKESEFHRFKDKQTCSVITYEIGPLLAKIGRKSDHYFFFTEMRPKSDPIVPKIDRYQTMT